MKTNPHKRAKKFAKSFGYDEDGSMIVFTLFLLIVMLLMGGLAVDMMRFETYRSRLQSTIDRAVLAASNLETCRGRSAAEVQDVVQQYAELNGFGGQITNIAVNKNENSCTVTADARLEMNTIFFQMVGIDQLGTPASSGAAESKGDVEISLVLDISGSMAGTKIEQLQDAASGFVTTLTDSIEQDRLSMSIVPYSTHVSVGTEMLAQYNLRHRHSYSACIDLPRSSYRTTAIDPALTYDQGAHFDPYAGAAYDEFVDAGTRFAGRTDAFVCPTRDSASILPMSGDADELIAHINGLETDYLTSIEIGANWGVALLDPMTQPVIAGLNDTQDAAGDDLVNDRYANRPLPYTTPEILKVMVLMTDGANTSDYVMSTSHRNQLSDVYFHWGELAYMTDPGILLSDPFTRGADQTYDPSDPDHQFFVNSRETNDFDGDGRRRESNYNVESERRAAGDRPRGETTTDNYWTNTRTGARQTWQDIWARVSVRSHAWNFRADQQQDFNEYNRWYNDLVTITYRAEKDARLRDICDAAHDNNIRVYTIGFEVRDNAVAVMADCASAPNHFFRVAGDELQDAFNSIATNISALRLTQ